MSAHDWPEFGLHPNPCYTENGNGDRYAIRLSREAYNYAKVRIDACAGKSDKELSGKLYTESEMCDAMCSAMLNVRDQLNSVEAERDALQQRCEELLLAIAIWQANPTTGNEFKLKECAAIAKQVQL